MAGRGGPSNGRQRELCVKPGVVRRQVVGRGKRDRVEGCGTTDEHLTTLVSTPSQRVSARQSREGIKLASY